MTLSISARQRIAGLWGAYEHRIIKEKHYPTAADLAEKFMERQLDIWRAAERLLGEDPSGGSLSAIYRGTENSDHITTARLDQELLRHETEIRELVYEWASRKITRVNDTESVKTLRTHLMFKKLYYGHGESMYFGRDIGAPSKARLSEVQTVQTMVN